SILANSGGRGSSGTFPHQRAAAVERMQAAAIVPAVILTRTPALAAAGAPFDARPDSAAVRLAGADSVALPASAPTSATDEIARPEVARTARSSSTPRESWLRTVFSDRLRASATSGDD